MRCEVLVGGEGLDMWLLEELGEDVGVWCGGGLYDEVGSGSWMCSGFGESQVWLFEQSRLASSVI